MKVRELIEALQDLDPDAPVMTIDTCDCHTHFVELEAPHIGAQQLEKLKLWAEREAEIYGVSDATAAWAKPLVVIAGGRWSRYPDFD